MYDTIQELKSELDRRMGMTSTLTKDTRGRESMLVYSSPTGVQLFCVLTAERSSKWQFHCIEYDFTEINRALDTDEQETTS